jgi:oligoribonuclease
VDKKKPLGNFVWIDLEMTGLDVHTDVILEIATVITDGDLNVIAEGPSFVISQSEEKLLRMDKWCVDQHGKSGLSKAVLESTISVENAEKETLNFIKKYCLEYTGVLSGNTVWQDRLFLKKYMPSIIQYLHYRLVDVSAIKELIKHWYSKGGQPKVASIDFKKSDNHRALEDIYESIAELDYYRKNFFV